MVKIFYVVTLGKEVNETGKVQHVRALSSGARFTMLHCAEFCRMLRVDPIRLRCRLFAGVYVPENSARATCTRRISLAA